jgi:hypothetical protein
MGTDKEAARIFCRSYTLSHRQAESLQGSSLGFPKAGLAIDRRK